MGSHSFFSLTSYIYHRFHSLPLFFLSPYVLFINNFHTPKINFTHSHQHPKIYINFSPSLIRLSIYQFFRQNDTKQEYNNISNMNVDYEKETFYKNVVIVIGDAGVGKTNLVFTFDKGKKPLSVNPTIGTEFTSKTLKLEDGRKAKTQIWDTAGQEQFKAVTMNYYRGAAGALIVFDINNHSSFEHVMEWYSAIRERADSTVQIGLVGHKADSSKRSVSRKQAQKFADAHNIFYMQTTVNDPQTIKTVFTKLLTQILNTKQKSKQGNILLNQSFSHDGNCTC